MHLLNQKANDAIGENFDTGTVTLFKSRTSVAELSHLEDPVSLMEMLQGCK